MFLVYCVFNSFDKVHQYLFGSFARAPALDRFQCLALTRSAQTDSWARWAHIFVLTVGMTCPPSRRTINAYGQVGLNGSECGRAERTTLGLGSDWIWLPFNGIHSWADYDAATSNTNEKHQSGTCHNENRWGVILHPTRQETTPMRPSARILQMTELYCYFHNWQTELIEILFPYAYCIRGRKEGCTVLS